MITKKKFDRIVRKIEESIYIRDNSLPPKLCSELRDNDLWEFWCDCVMEHCKPYEPSHQNSYRRLK